MDKRLEGSAGVAKFLADNASVSNIGGAVYAAMNGSFSPIAESKKRGGPKSAELNVKDQAYVILKRRLMALTNDFFQFYKQNKKHMDKCVAKIQELEAEYHRWLEKNKDVYDFEATKGLFQERMIESFDTAMLAMQMNKAFPQQDLDENIS